MNNYSGQQHKDYKIMKVIAFAASSSRNSINKKLVTHAANVLSTELNPEANIEILDLNDFPVPLYSVDAETDSGIPDSAKAFLDKIGQSNALLISYAEHNGSYTAAWKSLFDWMSRIEMKVFQEKPMVIFSTSPGPGGGANVLQQATASAPHFRADLKASLSIPSFNDAFDVASGKLKDEAMAQKLREALGQLKTQ